MSYNAATGFFIAGEGPSIGVPVTRCVIHSDGGTSNNVPSRVALVSATGLTG
jgi:hypothetical protein